MSESAARVWIEEFKRLRTRAKAKGPVTILTLLHAIHRKPRHSGICGQPAMTYLSPKAFSLVREMMVKWPKYSGSYDYPVPSVIEDYSPAECYHEKSKELWDRNNEYGRLRWELLEWLMAQPELNVRLYRVHGTYSARPVFTTKEPK